MAAPDVAVEHRALRVSIAAALGVSLAGIAWGVFSGSQMILLDGVYALVGIVVSWLLLRAASVAAREPTRRHPYGFEGVTPLAVGVQALVLLGTLAYAASEAFLTIRTGGSDVTAGWAIAYGALSGAVALATWWWLRRHAGSSDLLVSEAVTWRAAALTSAGMVIGFSVLAVLDGSSWDGAAPYVDPVLVLVTCVALLPSPLRLLRTTVGELLESSPGEPIQTAVRDAIEVATAGVDLDVTEVRVAKLGPKLYVEVEGAVDHTVTVVAEHEIRCRLNAELDRLPFDIWLNLELAPRRPAEPRAADAS